MNTGKRIHVCVNLVRLQQFLMMEDYVVSVMINIMTNLFSLKNLINEYIEEKITFSDFHETLSLNLQSLTENASIRELEIVGELLADLYEVEDGVLLEDKFRESLSKIENE